MTSGPLPIKFLTPYQLYAGPAERRILCGRLNAALPLGRPRHVSDRLWEEHRVPAALRQHLTRYFQNLHPAIFCDPRTVPPCLSRPSVSPVHPHLHGYAVYGCRQYRYRTATGSA